MLSVKLRENFGTWYSFCCKIVAKSVAKSVHRHHAHAKVHAHQSASTHAYNSPFCPKICSEELLYYCHDITRIVVLLSWYNKDRHTTVMVQQGSTYQIPKLPTFAPSHRRTLSCISWSQTDYMHALAVKWRLPNKVPRNSYT